jgi:catechol 2,3-dioxygenase-like lactoylglutathione lyase family enzyme
MIQTTKLDLFAGIPVTDYAAALKWYERLLGYPPAFFPLDTEAVWELAEHRYVYIVQQPEHAGHARHTLFVDDLDALVAQIAGRGLDPSKRETYSNGVRKTTYRDPDGNEIGLGGAPL